MSFARALSASRDEQFTITSHSRRLSDIITLNKICAIITFRSKRRLGVGVGVGVCDCCSYELCLFRDLLL